MSGTLALLSLALLAPSAAPPTHPVWVAEVGLSGAQLKNRTDALAGRGLRPVSVCGYNANESNRFAVVWAKRGDGEWSMSSGLTRKGFVDRAADLNRRGYQLTALSGYDLIGAERFADIWIKKKGADREWIVGLDQKALLETLDGVKGRNFRPIQVSSYQAGGANTFALLIEKGGDVEWRMKWDLSPSQFQDALDDLKARGYRPVSIAGLDVVGARYAAIWQKRDGPALEVRYGEDQDAFNLTVRAMAARGFHPVRVAGYNTLNGDRFATIWEKD